MPHDPDFYQDLLDNLSDGIYFVDRERVITYWNKGAERITGYERDEVLGLSCSDNLLNHVTVNGEELCGGECPLAACMQDGVVREADVFLHHADGHRVPVLVRAAPLRDEHGKIYGAVETFSSDMGLHSMRHQLRELRRAVNTDPLTQVGNRKYLESRLRAVLAQYKDQESNAALLFIDIDHFKKVNDIFGHDAGDKVLHMVAATLRQNLRSIDSIGRWGGEEFIVILDQVDSSENLKKICEKIRVLVESSRLDLQREHIRVTISIGATLLQPNDNQESLLARADKLMYQSKQAGRNCASLG